MDTYTAIDQGLMPEQLDQLQVEAILKNHGYDWHDAYDDYDFPMSFDGAYWDARKLFGWLGY